MPTRNPLTQWINPNRRHLTFQDVPVFNGHPNTLRCGLMLDQEGYPSELLMALGHGDGRSWREDPAAGGLILPAASLGALTTGLYHLEKVRQVFLVP